MTHETTHESEGLEHPAYGPEKCRDLLEAWLSEGDPNLHINTKHAENRLDNFRLYELIPEDESPIDLRGQVISVSVEIVDSGLTTTAGVTKPSTKPATGKAYENASKRLLGISFVKKDSAAVLYIEEPTHTGKGAINELMKGLIYVRNSADLEKLVFDDRTSEDIIEARTALYETFDLAEAELDKREELYQKRFGSIFPPDTTHITPEDPSQDSL